LLQLPWLGVNTSPPRSLNSSKKAKIDSLASHTAKS
jgi:hypothetical protein